MKDPVESYFQELHHILQEIVTTNHDCVPVRFNTGVNHIIGIIQDLSYRGNKLMFVGNGASASISSHQAVDFSKRAGIRAMAFNDASLLTCLSNDFGYPDVFAKSITLHADPGDLLVAISSSGQSENILNAVDAARESNCQVVTLSGINSSNPLRSMGDMNFYVPSPFYGHIEIAHLTILHSMVDILIQQKQHKQSQTKINRTKQESIT